MVFPEAAAVQAMVREHGMNLFYESVENRQLCCRLRKVEPNRRYLAELDAWVTGLRRDQGVTRTEVAQGRARRSARRHRQDEPDRRLDATTRCSATCATHNVPINRLHAEGYPVASAARPCTRAVAAGRRSARGPLVVGERGHARVRHPRRRREGGVGHLRLDASRADRSSARAPWWRWLGPRARERRFRADAIALLERSAFVYVSPLKSDGAESRCHGEVWYGWLDGRVA